MLAGAHAPHERGRMQGLNDLLVFGGVTFASLASGGLMNCSGGDPIQGWSAVNMAMIPFLVLAAGRAIAARKTLALAATEYIAGLAALETLPRLRRARSNRFSARSANLATPASVPSSKGTRPSSTNRGIASSQAATPAP